MNIPAGYATINPFIICDDVDGLIRFLTAVFDGVAHPEARTLDTDGLVLHDELQIGDVTVMFADRKPDWPFTPSLLQIYVEDARVTLDRAVELGAHVITEPTPFYGSTFSRMRDPWMNTWWVYDVQDAADGDAWGEDGAGGEPWDAGAAGEGEAQDAVFEQTPELTYIRDGAITAFTTLRDPRG